MKFPQYRRYKNGQSYFKIVGQDEFYEYKLTVNQLEEFHIVAKILPDRNYISDMLQDDGTYWEKIDFFTFSEFVDKYEKN